ncbi:Sir2 family NAD+-dependent deacetylase [Alteromonas facilis]|uniref:Sir2 family NAD+-dependent deacetylase n=1 Tax=Alteromonas facilis TaxID=2048004 RepID=UPI000C281CD3|nr:Sir2 family NAD+-dependent deacetylase [Alteromonas facilis]
MSKPNVVVLTGAGISAESGLKTFRDNNGLWENHRLEDVATPEAFHRNPDLVYRFYNERRRQLQSPDVTFNQAHTALSDLEDVLGSNLTLVTQNVDNLHERAGSKRVYHMHGKLLSARCCKSGQQFAIDCDFDGRDRCHCCSPTATIRPDIVWFGEMPMYMDVIEDALTQADWFISIGTSGNVYPAAGFVEIAKFSGAKTVELNLEPSNNNHLFDIQINGPATQVVPQFLTSTFME